MKKCFPDVMKKTMEICKGDSKGDVVSLKPNSTVCVSLRPSMAPLAQFVSMKNASQSTLAAFCGPMNSSTQDSDSMKIMKSCFPDMVKKAMEKCKGYSKGDDKGEKHEELIETKIKYGADSKLVGLSIYSKTVMQSSKKRPGLLVFPGPYGDGGGKYEREVARKYARKGFVVFVVDYFPTSNSENNATEVGAA